MIRILEIFGEPLTNAGQETFIMNMYKNVEKDKIQFDFFTPFYCDNIQMKEEIEQMGGNVWTGKKPFNKRKNKYVKEAVKKILKQKKYNVVHIHSGSTYSLMIIAKVAKKSGVKNVIVHSHCGGFENLKYKIIKKISGPFFLKYADYYCACSNLAARWKFPKDIIKEKRYTILKNAIDTSNIFFSNEIREKKRKELNISQNFVVGHIGRFATQKNHEFLIDIFNEIQKKKENALLLLIGDGELKLTIEEKAKKLGIKDKVKFLGIRKDILELLNVMDVFVLPSFFEGLPVVGVEAEGTGLPVFTSTSVANELPIESLSHYYSLKESAEYWANNIIMEYERHQRINTTQDIIESGYEVKIAAKKLEEMYIRISKEDLPN